MLENLAAKVVIGNMNSIGIVQEANAALDDVLTSRDPGCVDTLIQLATSTDLNADEAGDLLKKSFTEMGWPWPTLDEAVDTLIRDWLMLIIEKEVGPQTGMCELRNIVLGPSGVLDHCENYVGDSVGMERLIGAYYSYDDIYGSPNTGGVPLLPPEEAIRKIDGHIRELAQEWLDNHPVDIKR